MKKILVTGGSGLIGSWLKKELPDVVYISSKDYDLTNEFAVASLFMEHQPHTIIHLAAKVSGLVDNLNHPVAHLDDNILMNTLMLKYAHKYKVERFVAILSGGVYPNEWDKFPLKEEYMHEGAPHGSIFSYAIAKRVMATQIDNYNKEFGTEYNYLIPCNFYGPTDKDDKIIPIMINKVLDARKNGDSFITLFGDGTPIRQFMYSKDMAGIIKEVIDKDIIESFNVAADEIVTIEEMARVVLKVMDAEDLEIRYDTTKSNGQMRRDLDISKFKSLIPDYKFVTLQEGITELYSSRKQTT
jgi:GDP-L-fucose synthase